MKHETDMAGSVPRKDQDSVIVMASFFLKEHEGNNDTTDSMQQVQTSRQDRDRNSGYCRFPDECGVKRMVKWYYRGLSLMSLKT